MIISFMIKIVNEKHAVDYISDDDDDDVYACD